MAAMVGMVTDKPKALWESTIDQIPKVEKGHFDLIFKGLQNHIMIKLLSYFTFSQFSTF
jgi:hypothetical protein